MCFIHPYYPKKFIAQFKHRVNGKAKTHYLGLFNDEADAALKYDTIVYAYMLAGTIPEDLSMLNFGISEFPKSELDDIMAINTTPTATMTTRLKNQDAKLSSSGYRGVSWYVKHQYWKANIQIS